MVRFGPPGGLGREAESCLVCLLRTSQSHFDSPLCPLGTSRLKIGRRRIGIKSVLKMIEGQELVSEGR